MNISRRLLVILALLIADSTWLYVALALVSFVVERESALLSWPWVLLVLSTGAVVGTLGQGLAWLTAKFLAGAGMVYLAAASLPELGGLELSWILRLYDGVYPVVTVGGLIVAVLGAAWLWRHGGLIATEPFLEQRTIRHFRAGVMVLAVALLFEVVGNTSFAVANMLAPFFAASLAGLALARMADGGRGDLNWTLIISISVVLTLAVGLVVGVMIGLVGRAGANALAIGWGYLAGFLGDALWLIVGPILEVIFAVMTWLFEIVRGPNNPWDSLQPDLPEPVQTVGPPSWDWPLKLWPFALGLLIIVLLYRALRPIVRRIGKTFQPTVETLHESIRTDAQPLADLARLLRLAFGLSAADKERARRWRYPPGETGITDAFQLYFRLLQASIARGHAMQACATPLERVSDLCVAVPGAPADQITQCFNRACYGRSPTDVATIDALRAQLENALNSGEIVSPRV